MLSRIEDDNKALYYFLTLASHKEETNLETIIAVLLTSKPAHELICRILDSI